MIRVFTGRISNDHRWVFSTGVVSCVATVMAQLTATTKYCHSKNTSVLLKWNYVVLTEIQFYHAQLHVYRNQFRVRLYDMLMIGNIGGSSEFDVLVPQGRIGGNAKAIAGMELIVPTPFLDEENTSSVRTSFFVDAANVWDTEFNVDRYQNLAADERAKLNSYYSDPMRFRVSTGLSLQWISPMVHVRSVLRIHCKKKKMTINLHD